VDICTIIAKNYVAYARVLARSFREHHPDSRCHTLVIDDVEGKLDADEEPFELVTPAQIGLPEFTAMAARYDVVELSTAVKPWFLRHLLHDRGLQKVAYLDPDIEVLDSLGEIDALLDDHEIALIPHLTEPIPDDGRKPSATDILIAGSYNLGFVALARRPQVDRLLDWWSERLRTECVVAPERGIFVDQRWMDFVPGFMERVAVVRDSGYDVAYWNLHSRPIERRDGHYYAAGSPLRFMHYSGFDPLQPDRLSKHQNRIRLTPGEPLAELCERYAEQVLANGHAEAREWSYAYDALPDGMPLDRVTRAAYVIAELQGAVRHSIFEPLGAGELLDWLISPADIGGAQGVNRYLATLREVRPGLLEAFPDLAGHGGSDLVAWARVYGRTEVPIPDALLPGLGAPRVGAAQGVNVVGYFDAVLGVGEAARQMLGALQDARIAVATIAMSASASPREQTLVRKTVAPRFPVNLICVNADMVSAFAQQVGTGFFTDRYSIGYWWWEVSRFPDRWLGSFKHLDEVWAGSRHVADALAEVSPVPVVRIPPPVEMAEPPPRTRAELRLPEGFVFLFVFDYASVFERKNPLAVVEAFKRAFGEGEGPSLVIKSINHERDLDSRERLRAAIAGRSDVHAIEDTVSPAEKDAMVASCDCFVSLHRSEGFGFTLAEAMWLGRPVIATGYSGNLDYMTADNSWLVDFDLVPIGADAEPYPPDGEWAQPDIGHAATLMREVFEDPLAARERAARGQAQLRTSHSRAAVGRAIARRLARIDRSTARSGGGAPALVHGELARTTRRIQRGPTPTGRSRFGRLQLALRRLVLRLIKPFTVHQRIVDEELVRAVSALGDGLAGAHMRIDELSRHNGAGDDPPRGDPTRSHSARGDSAQDGAAQDGAGQDATDARRSAAPRD
jgi:glycosyltransferase involved in cell wall biosynthesis